MTKEDYIKTLETLKAEALKSPNMNTTQPNKVACIVAVGHMRDELTKAYGKIPMEALYAMRDFMADNK